MNQWEAQANEQINTETVDHLLNKNVCEKCGGEIKEKIIEDANGVSGEVELGHLDDCPLIQI